MARNRNNNRNQQRRELLSEARALHDMSMGEKHCDPNKIHDCVNFQMLIPQAAENIKKRKRGDGSIVSRVS